MPTYYTGYGGTVSGTNIIFSNGELDPYSSGGVYDCTDGQVCLYIENAAHHLDLRTPNSADPDTVVNAREIELETIQSWIADYMTKR